MADALLTLATESSISLPLPDTHVLPCMHRLAPSVPSFTSSAHITGPQLPDAHRNQRNRPRTDSDRSTYSHRRHGEPWAAQQRMVESFYIIHDTYLQDESHPGTLRPAALPGGIAQAITQHQAASASAAVPSAPSAPIPPHYPANGATPGSNGHSHHTAATPIYSGGNAEQLRKDRELAMQLAHESSTDYRAAVVAAAPPHTLVLASRLERARMRGSSSYPYISPVFFLTLLAGACTARPTPSPAFLRVLPLSHAPRNHTVAAHPCKLYPPTCTCGFGCPACMPVVLTSQYLQLHNWCCCKPALGSHNAGLPPWR